MDPIKDYFYEDDNLPTGIMDVVSFFLVPPAVETVFLYKILIIYLTNKVKIIKLLMQSIKCIVREFNNFRKFGKLIGILFAHIGCTFWSKADN